ncbi:MAG: peptidase M14 [Ruminococcaceae bacterium]|nr:peptidase M14 [Oscillospiraceae bacterium]
MEKEFDYAALMCEVRRLANRFSFLNFSYLTESEAGRAIPMLSLGVGKKQIYYIGAHHGAERITSAVLIKFISEFCNFLARGATAFGTDLEYVLQTRTIRIVPMLNPDGVEISANGVQSDSLWYTRLVAMNGGSLDFTHWQANARGVDLNHNYDAGFEEYKEVEKTLGITGPGATRYSGERAESEAESSALCNFLRFNPPAALMTLHTQGREIYYSSCGSYTKGAKAAAEYLSRLTGYKCAVPIGAAAYGGLTDYCIQKLKIPAFTIECGKGKNPLPPHDTLPIYLEMRKALFAFLTLF